MTRKKRKRKRKKRKRKQKVLWKASQQMTDIFERFGESDIKYEQY
jgi:transposase